MKTSRPLNRSGFTLTELLVVIAIIGIIVSLTLVGVNSARKTAIRAAIRVDIQNLEGSVEAYKQKFSDFPPDFTRKDVVRRHILKVWPRIDTVEQTLAWNTFWVDPANDNDHRSYVDPAEALAFWLGGFSSNAKRPFTGTGGPWVVDSTGIVYYNPERNVGTFEFDSERLTLNATPVVTPTVSGFTSYDTGGMFPTVDAFPVYLPKRRKVPYVYFDSRTYGGVTPFSSPPSPDNGFYTVPHPEAPFKSYGFAKPYLSDRKNPNSLFGVRPPPPAPGYDWVNKTTFQIISAGLDDHYGSQNFLTDIAFYPNYPSGEYYQLAPGDDDNITNFTEGNMRK